MFWRHFFEAFLYGKSNIISIWVSVLPRNEKRRTPQGQGSDLSNIYVFSVCHLVFSYPLNSGGFVEMYVS